MNIFLILPALLMLGACNYMTVKSGTMDKGEVIYAKSGGYGMQRVAKEELEERGYTVLVGKEKSELFINNNDDNSYIDINTSIIPSNAQYIIKVTERSSSFSPIWCFFNGYWWWNFNISISNQSTGQELLAWAGRGCASSSVRKFNRVMEKLEK